LLLAEALQELVVQPGQTVLAVVVLVVMFLPALFPSLLVNPCRFLLVLVEARQEQDLAVTAVTAGTQALLALLHLRLLLAEVVALLLFPAEVGLVHLAGLAAAGLRILEPVLVGLEQLVKATLVVADPLGLRHTAEVEVEVLGLLVLPAPRQSAEMAALVCNG
jgi:hypothetical protein